jgi:hypothetical protein
MATSACARFALAALAAMAALTALARAAPVDAGAAAQWRAGQAIYRDGVLSSGKSLTAPGAAGVLRQGRDAACVACHRRSGFGIAEGEVVVRPITAPDLFGESGAVTAAATPRIAHQLGTRRRPVYDAAALAAALRSGIDAAGRQMHGMMPRYALGEADMAALQAYLKTLYTAPDPGVDEQEIHLATVIQPGVAPARRQAMLDVLQAFVHDKNAGVRSEVARRKGGAMRMHRAYRGWVLDVWELAGAPDEWGAQLDEFYRRQPVFALVSGIGELGWQPVQDFSERQGVPCILPQTSVPGTAMPNFYTVYFSRGIALEAEALASRLGAAHAVNKVNKVIQVFRPGQAASLAAATALRAALPAAAARLQDIALDGPMTAAQWRALAGADAVLLLWLGERDLPAQPLERRRPTWLSASLLDGAAAPAGSRLGITSPWELPDLRAANVRRSTDWLRARGLADQSPAQSQLQVQVNTLYAITMVGEALSHLMDSFSRDYFVETVEHDLATTTLSSFYPPLTLGPDQRHASKGVYLLPAVQLVVP